MTAALADLEARVADLEAIVGRQAAALARFESNPRLAADPLRGLPPARRWLFDRIVDECTTAWHLGAGELLSPSRFAYIIQPRFAAVWLFRRLSGLSIPRVAAAFGYGDHTSIMHALRRAEAWREIDPDFKTVVDRLLERLRDELAEWRP